MVAATSSDLRSCLCMVDLHKIYSKYLRTVGRLEMPESSSGRRCQELLGTMAGREELVTHSQGPAGSHPPASCGCSPACRQGHINSSWRTGHPWYDASEGDAKHGQREFKSGAAVWKYVNLVTNKQRRGKKICQGGVSRKTWPKVQKQGRNRLSEWSFPNCWSNQQLKKRFKSM